MILLSSKDMSPSIDPKKALPAMSYSTNGYQYNQQSDDTYLSKTGEFRQRYPTTK